MPKILFLDPLSNTKKDDASMRNITKVLNWTEKFKTFGILPKYKKNKNKKNIYR